MSKKQILIVVAVFVLILGSLAGYLMIRKNRLAAAPSASPSPVAFATTTPAPTPDDFPSPSPLPSPSVKPSVKPIPTPTPVPSVSPSPTPTPSPSPSPSPSVTSLTLSASASLDGWRASNGGSNTTWYLQIGHNATMTERSFVSFDLSSIPSGVTIDSATLRLYQTENVGTPYSGASLVLDHVNYGSTWSATPYDGSPLSSVGTFTTNGNIEWKNMSVTDSVKDDIANSRGRAQFGLHFSPESMGTDAWARFESADNYAGSGNTPQLVVTYH